MKVICITNKGYEDVLTIGKIYDTPSHESNNGFVPYHNVPVGLSSIFPAPYWDIISDNGARLFFLKDKFITLEEFRNEKLNELGI